MRPLYVSSMCRTILRTMPQPGRLRAGSNAHPPLARVNRSAWCPHGVVAAGRAGCGQHRNVPSKTFSIFSGYCAHRRAFPLSVRLRSVAKPFDQNPSAISVSSPQECPCFTFTSSGTRSASPQEVVTLCMARRTRARKLAAWEASTSKRSSS